MTTITMKIMNSEFATFQFDGKGVREGRRSYYRSVTLDGNLTVNVGDHVIINGDTATDSRLQLHVGVIAKIYDETGGTGTRAVVRAQVGHRTWRDW